HGLAWRELLLGLDHAPAPAVDHGVEALQPASGEKRQPPPGTGADPPDLAAYIGQRAEEGVRAFEIAEHPGVRGPPGRAHLGPNVFRRAVAVAAVQGDRER